MKNLARKLWARRSVRATLWTLVSLVTFLVLIAQLFERRAWKNWLSIRAEVESTGETFDFPSILPEPLDPATNFCATPALLGIADDAKGKPRREALAVFELKAREGMTLPSAPQAALTGLKPDLGPWITALASQPATGPEALLAALADQDAIVVELQAALGRPRAAWTPDWRERKLPDMLFAMTMPHYSVSLPIARSLVLRSLAETTAGLAAPAHDDLRVILRLAEANFGDPLLIGLLVGNSHTSLAANGAWSLCEARLGSAEAFGRLSQEFAHLDLDAAALRAWRGEMAGAVSSLESMAGPRNWTAAEREALFGTRGMARIGLPRAMIRENITTLASLQWKHCLKPLREGGIPALQEQGAALTAALEEFKASPLRRPGSFIATMAMPASDSVASSLMQTEVLRIQAAIACALERHHLTHGTYPDSLEAVELPRITDPWSGSAMRYERTPAGRYRIWSVGPDRVDDGGTRNLDPAAPAKTKFRDNSYRGDWVWDYPE